MGEFPFLALLGYTGEDKIHWLCGGSIINQWYVLSAAQCGRSYTPDYVRLGEWKLEDDPKNKTDCETVEGVRACTQPYQVGLYMFTVMSIYLMDFNFRQDIAVADLKIHPNFGETPHGLVENDIMLVKLSSPAVFNDFVQPVCLPS